MTTALVAGCVIVLTGLLLCWVGIRRFAKGRLASAITLESSGVVLLVVAVLLLLVASNLVIYQRLLHEAPVAKITFYEVEPFLYTAELKPANGRAQYFEMRGDEWQLDARILKWQGLGNLLGLDARIRLHRLSGRYTDIAQELVASRSIYQLGDQPTVDFWAIASGHSDWFAWLVDAAYGSAVYLPMIDAAEYEVSVSQSGLVARPANAIAKDAVSNWL